MGTPVDDDRDLDALTERRSELARDHASGKLECVACAHRCKLGAGKRGICQLRFADGVGLRVPWGYVAGFAVDPIEKKPFFHVRPGIGALSFGMLGCDLHCSFCQNWFTSQSLKDPASTCRVRELSAEQLVQAALHNGCEAVISTYNEPLITAEWAHQVFSVARSRGLLTGFVSNGHATEEVLDFLEPVLDLYKIDLKSFRATTYRSLGGRLEAVTAAIESLHRRGRWIEVVTLVVPGLNDDPAELGEMASFLAGVSPDIPWHVTAFHPDYELTDRGATPLATLARAREMGLEAGLRFVYAGNVPGAVAHGEETCCPGCRALLVERRGFRVVANRIGGTGICPGCGRRIPGVW